MTLAQLGELFKRALDTAKKEPVPEFAPIGCVDQEGVCWAPVLPASTFGKMDEVRPTVGRIVLFKLNAHDVKQFSRLGGEMAQVSAGEVFPALVVKVHSPQSLTLRVFTTGEEHTVHSRPKSTSADHEDGTWCWPPLVGKPMAPIK